MIARRYQAVSTRLADGRVLIVSGIDANDNFRPLTTAELYDPATNSWSETVGLAQLRLSPSIVLLGNGDVLLAGGTNCSSTSLLATAERFQLQLLAIGAPCTDGDQCVTGVCTAAMCAQSPSLGEDRALRMACGRRLQVRAFR